MMTSEKMVTDTGIEEIIWWMKQWEETFATGLDDKAMKKGMLIRELCAGLIPAWIIWEPDNSQLLINAIVDGKIDIRALNALLTTAVKDRGRRGVRPPAQLLGVLAAMQLSEKTDSDTTPE
jgi:hypothetical protein